MTVRQIAICEKNSFLTATLEREFASDVQISFRWFPYIQDLLKHLQSISCELAIVDSHQLDSQSLIALANLSLHVRLILTCPGEDFEFECLLRELGATSVIPIGEEVKHIVKTVSKLIHRNEASRNFPLQ